MPSREPELYKDKIEVSLDGRQIFYLFFGGAAIAGLVFVLGVLVGRRIEARGHLDGPDHRDRADLQVASDPLAALDRLERADELSYHGALTGSDAPTDVEKAIGEIERSQKAGGVPDSSAGGAGGSAPRGIDKRRAAGHGEPAAIPAAGAPTRPAGDAHPDAAARAEADRARADRREADKHEADKHEADKHEADKREADKREADKRDDRKPRKRDDADGHKPASRDEPVTRPERAGAAARGDAAPDSRERSAEARADKHDDARSDGKPGKTEARSSEGRIRFTLQLSSFHDRAEAEAFLSQVKSAGFGAFLTEAEVGGKGTFYRVRLGSYRSLEAASDAKAEYEKAAKKTAQIMRL